MNKEFDIEQFMNLRGYDNEERKLRRKTRVAGQFKKEVEDRLKQSKAKPDKPTAEYFTPYSIVKRMAEKIPEADWSDPKKTILEPCFGNGQFVVYIVYNRIMHGVSWKDTLETLYGVELMSDNVAETKDRVIRLLTEMDVEFEEQEARVIMNKNLVCSNFFEWDFDNWCPLYKKSVELF